MSRLRRFTVSFDFADDRPGANTLDFRHELEAFFEQAVLENRMTNVKVQIDLAKELEDDFRRKRKRLA